jgi:hypothetical protein
MNTEEKGAAFGSAGKGARRDWAKSGSAEADALAVPQGAGAADKKIAAVVPGKPGEAGKSKGAGKGKGAGKARGKGAGGFMDNPIMQKMMKNLSPEEMASMRGASPEERLQLQKKAGLTDDEIEQLAEMRRNYGGGGGGGPGGGGGRFGGGRPGGGGGAGGSDQ